MRNSQHFTEPQGSLTCPQESSNGPYPEIHKSSPQPPILFPSDSIWYHISICT